VHSVVVPQPSLSTLVHNLPAPRLFLQAFYSMVGSLIRMRLQTFLDVKDVALSGPSFVRVYWSHGPVSHAPLFAEQAYGHWNSLFQTLLRPASFFVPVPPHGRIRETFPSRRA